MLSCSVFQCLSLPDDYKRGKLLAYQLLCQTVVKRHDVLLSTELLSQFYMCLHTGIGTRDQVSHCRLKSKNTVSLIYPQYITDKRAFLKAQVVG